MKRSKSNRKKFVCLIALAFILLVNISAAQAQQDFSSYIWQEYQPVDPDSVPPDLKQKLEAEIDRMIQDRDDDGKYDHLAPLHVAYGLGGSSVNYLWSYRNNNGVVELSGSSAAQWHFINPADLVYTLSLAYPYLASDLQAKVKSYLATEMADYNMFTIGNCWGSPPPCFFQGLRRELYDLPPPNFVNVWPPFQPPIWDAYALWLYADRTGDWATVSNNWTNMNSAYARVKDVVNIGKQITYADIGGLIGYARIAKQLGYQTQADEAASLANQWLNAGLDFNQFGQNLNQYLVGHENAVPVFYYLVPEVGGFLRDKVRVAVQTYVDDLTSKTKMYQWWQARVGKHGVTGENEYFSPHISWPIFLAKAYVLQENQSQLRKYLDIPWSIGDLYYIQKLTAAIEAGKPASPDLNQDQKVNSQDIAILLSSWGRTDKPSKDLASDGKIDTQDLLQILSNWTSALAQNVIYSPLSILNKILNDIKAGFPFL